MSSRDSSVERVGQVVNRTLDGVMVLRSCHVFDESAVDLLDRVMDDEVLLGQPIDHRSELRLAAGKVRKHQCVFGAVMLGRDPAVAGTEPAQRPVVLAQRSR